MRPRWIVGLAALVIAGSLGATPDTLPDSPETVLTAYLAAIKAGEYGDAYEHISEAMRQGKDKEAWVAQTKSFMSFADVKIFDFKVYPGKAAGDKAQVPNLLESQDRFVNALGLSEYELYTLVREGGRWRVDSQLLLEPAQVPTWFPDAKKE